MSDEGAFHRLRLIRSQRIGPVTYRQLIARFGSATAALDALPELARRGGASAVRIADAGAVEREIRATEKAGARFLFYGDQGYPPLLARLADAPAVLLCKGRRELLERPGVAMVGARNASAAAVKLARSLAGELAGTDFIVISGLARGIDTAAHEGSLDGGTIAVIAGGIDNIYPPENAKLQAAIAERGLLLSEMPFGTEPRARHFPHRNRIIAGLAFGVVVVEAAPRSGSLITARLAGEAGREVMAVPGSPLDPRSRGCNGLIRDGATLVQSAGEIAEALRDLSGTTVRDPAPFAERSAAPELDFAAPLPDGSGPDPRANGETAPDARPIEDLLSANFVGVNELVRQARTSVEDVQLQLLELELAGRLERGAGAKVRLTD